MEGKSCATALDILYGKINNLKNGWLIFVDCRTAFRKCKRDNILNSFGKSIGKGKILDRITNLYGKTYVKIKFKWGETNEVQM